MDKVAELLATIPFKNKLIGERSKLVKDKLKSGELSFDDIVNYNESANNTKLLPCTTCDNISEVAKPTYLHNTAPCFECESFF